MRELCQQIHEELRQRDNYLITTHTSPDPDGIGAGLGLYELLRALDKDVELFYPDEISPKYRFLDPESRIATFPEDAEQLPHPEATLVVVDNSDLFRCGRIAELAEEEQAPILILDHHDSRSNGSSVLAFQCPDLGSTSELIYELLEYAAVTPSLSAARALYAGIISDTGNFRFRKTQPRTHEIAAALLRCGVEPAEISEQLYLSSAVERLFVRRELYKHLYLNEERTIAWFALHQKELDAVKSSGADLDGIVNELIEPAQIQVGIIFKERDDGTTRVSLRSKGSIDLLPAVSRYGGGGHKNACGATIPLDLSSTVAELIPLVASRLS